MVDDVTAPPAAPRRRRIRSRRWSSAGGPTISRARSWPAAPNAGIIPDPD